MQDIKYNQPLPSHIGGSASSPRPALTINIPYPTVEKESSPLQAHITTGGATVGGNTVGYNGGISTGSTGRTAASISSRTKNEATAAEHTRYKSLFTNAPSELPGVSVVPAGRGDGSAVAETASAQHSVTAGKERGNASAGGIGGGGGINPIISRRAQTAKIDYHNSVRRRSSNTSFTHPVGHPDGLDALVSTQSRPDALEGWADEQTGVAASAGASRRAIAKAGATVAANVNGEDEPYRWIPGAHTNRAPVVHSHTKNNAANRFSGRRRLSSPTKSASAAHEAPGSATSSPSADATVASTNRLAQPRLMAAATPSRPRGSGDGRSDSGNRSGNGRGGWVGAVLDDPRVSSSSPSVASPYSELPRQLAVPGSLRVAEEGETVVGGLLGNGTDSGFGAAGPRLQVGTGSSGGGKMPPGAGGGKMGGVGGLNNLHPAWRPKGLSRRQRAVSIIERG